MDETKKKGVCISTREAAEARRLYYLKKKGYWEKFEKKKGNHKVVWEALFTMHNAGGKGEFLILPLFLEKFLYLYLNKYHPSQQNLQLAVNTTRVFSVLCHQYHWSATKYNMIASFFVAPSVWEKWSVGRKAKESGLRILQEMGVIIPPYHFNHNKHATGNEIRIVNMYQFNARKVMWLRDCVEFLGSEETGKKEFGITKETTIEDIEDDVDIDLYEGWEPYEGWDPKKGLDPTKGWGPEEG